MTTRAFDLSNLAGVGQYVRRYAQTDLRADIAAIAITALACYAAVVWPTIAYLLLLTAVATNIWQLGALRANALDHLHGRLESTGHKHLLYHYRTR